ncbi:MAG: SDR family NAD(P)-dependent oxidoreductase [Bacteroidetes bacterium]|nr:SDR family NAD(P)-dependent oxidoreductase [Bacteroidota bacterium]
MTPYNPFSLDQRKYLVTGAASGIGKATSIILAKLGAALILADINEEGLKDTLRECGPGNIVLKLDLLESQLIKPKLMETVTGFGQIHGFVHLAGRPYIAPLKAVSETKCKEIFDINTYAAIELAKAFINKNIYAGERGSVVLVSSVYGIVGSAANVAYAMSKAALHGITKSLSIELAVKDIRVNCVAPGFVKTNMLDTANDMFDDNYAQTINKLHPLGLGEPEDVAFAIAYLLSDAAKWVTGSILNIDGGFTAQ